MLGEQQVAQVVELSRQGAPAAEIARELGIQEPLVRLALRANAAGSEDDRDINDAQLELLRKRAFQLAFVDDATVSARMTMFLIERDKPSHVVSGGVNITSINNAIVLANNEYQRLKESYESPNSNQGQQNDRRLEEARNKEVQVEVKVSQVEQPKPALVNEI